MCCRIVDLKDKQVICIKDGSCLGYVYDVEIDTCNGKLISIIVPQRGRFFGIFGRDDDLVIPWCEIEVIGEDTILVGAEIPKPLRRKKRFFSNFYGE